MTIRSLRTALVRGTAEHYADPVLYDHEYKRRRQDIRFYRECCKSTQGRVLELGCGTGRVTIPLLKQGTTVVGIDLNAPMLYHCLDRITRAGRRIKGPFALLQGDMRALPVDGPFEQIICPFNAFMHLYLQPDIDACLGEVRRTLAPGGRFIFDVLNPDLRWLLRDPRKRWARTRFTHPVTGQKVIYSTNHIYDAKRQIAHVTIYYDLPDEPSKSYSVALAHRQFFPQELRQILRHNGFVVEAEYGDFSRRSFESDSDSQILVCRKER